MTENGGQGPQERPQGSLWGVEMAGDTDYNQPP